MFYPSPAATLQFLVQVRREIHSERSLRIMREKRVNLQSTLKKYGELRAGKGWKFLKFFALCKFEMFAMHVASAAFTDTGFQEAQHKFLKPSAMHTNNRPNDKLAQTMKHAKFGDTVEMILREQPSRSQRRMHAHHKAAASGRAEASTPTVVVTMAELQNLSACREEVARVAEHIPELCEFPEAMNGVQELQGDTDRLCIEIMQHIGIPCYFHIGAPTEGVKLGCKLSQSYDRNWPRYVAVRAEGYSRESPEEWYAEVICYVRGVTDRDTRNEWNSPLLCYVRWLEEDTSDPDHPVIAKLGMKLLRKESIGVNDNGKRRKVDRLQLIYAHDILRPVYVQQCPKIADRRKKHRQILNTYIPFCL